MLDYCGICGESYDEDNLERCKQCGRDYCYKCSGFDMCKRCFEKKEQAEKPEAAPPFFYRSRLGLLSPRAE